MELNAWRFLTLLLAGLGMTMGAAHVLELAPKMSYAPELYAAVNTTLYRYFGVAGAVLTIGSILAAAVLAVLVRGRPSFGPSLAGALSLVLSFSLWLLLVAPVNAQVAEALRSAPESVPGVWAQLRNRWEYGHVAAFLAWLLGFGLLLFGVLREVPAEAPEAAEAPDQGRAATPRPRATA
jgi:hypothetical protein